jgi:hypothetical protein
MLLQGGAFLGSVILLACALVMSSERDASGFFEDDLYCSGNNKDGVNPCGKQVECNDPENCLSWFIPSGSPKRLIVGLPTDNWRVITPIDIENCGNGGDCRLRLPDECIPLDGHPVHTEKLKNYGECIVRQPGPPGP